MHASCFVARSLVHWNQLCAIFTSRAPCCFATARTWLMQSVFSQKQNPCGSGVNCRLGLRHTLNIEAMDAILQQILPRLHISNFRTGSARTIIARKLTLYSAIFLSWFVKPAASSFLTTIAKLSKTQASEVKVAEGLRLPMQKYRSMSHNGSWGPLVSSSTC